MASLLDAHPNVIIANDFNILGEWINNPLLSKRNKFYMYELLYAKSRYDVMYGVRSRMMDGKPVQYHYNIKGQWQGRYNNSIQVNGAYEFNPDSFHLWILSTFTYQSLSAGFGFTAVTFSSLYQRSSCNNKLYAFSTVLLGPVVRQPISANPRLNRPNPRNNFILRLNSVPRS